MDLTDAIHQHVDRLRAAAERIDAAVVEGAVSPGPLVLARALVELHVLAVRAERLAERLERIAGTTARRADS